VPAHAPDRGAAGTPRASVAELAAHASYASQRAQLYRRRVYLGRGELTRLAELERISAGAADRLRRARDDEKQGAR
jgi:hypothetical protein